MFASLLAFKGVALWDLCLKRTLEAMGATGLQERQTEETQDTEAGEGAGGLGQGSGLSALLDIPEQGDGGLQGGRPAPEQGSG